MKKLKWWWLPFLFVLQLVDCVLTSEAGIQQEGNVLVALVWMILGWEAIVIIKALTILVCIAACRFFYHPKNPMHWMRIAFHAEMIIVVGTGFSACIWNLAQLN